MDLTESYKKVFPEDVLERYTFEETRSAAAVLAHTNAEEFDHLVTALREFELIPRDVIEPGKNESKIAARLNESFRSRGWREGQYNLKISSLLRLMPYKPAGEKKAIEIESEVESAGYKVDNIRSTVALDVEWNAKDGNLDRDVAAYRSLYDAGFISVGVIVTRTTDDLRALGALYDRPKFLGTTTTTNLPKLKQRMTRGDGGGCPMLAIAISAKCFDPDGDGHDEPEALAADRDQVQALTDGD